VSEEDPTTQELRLEQLQREATERERAEGSIDDDEAEQHERRAEKAGYLRAKLEQRARAEREAGGSDQQG
jgi:transcription elongation GreA/GreB family factor